MTEIDKGIYFIKTCENDFVGMSDVVAFNKKYYTKEQAFDKFKKMYPKAKIIDIKGNYVRYLIWNVFIGYEYVEIVSNSGYRISNKGGKGASDCWIIKRELCKEYDYFI